MTDVDVGSGVLFGGIENRMVRIIVTGLGDSDLGAKCLGTSDAGSRTSNAAAQDFEHAPRTGDNTGFLNLSLTPPVCQGPLIDVRSSVNLQQDLPLRQSRLSRH